MSAIYQRSARARPPSRSVIDPDIRAGRTGPTRAYEERGPNL